MHVVYFYKTLHSLFTTGQFAKFTTRKYDRDINLVYIHYLLDSFRGKRVTSLGVLFDFTGNDHNTTVQKVEDMVKEGWVCCNFGSRE